MADIAVDEFLRGNYLEQSDFTTPRTMTLIKVEARDVGGDEDRERKLHVWFSGEDRALVMNKTNIGILKAAFGNMASNWIGKQVEVYVDSNVMFGGKRVGGLRMRIPQTAQIETDLAV